MQQTQERPSRRATVYRVVALVASLAFVSVLVVTSSRAAFVDTTDNTNNSFQAGTVELVDDDTGSVLFNLANLAPSDPRTNCIRVTYNGSLPANVRLYGAASGALAPYLDLTVEVGTGGTFGNCGSFAPSSVLYSGTLADFATAHTDFTNGLAGWNGATTGTNRTYRLTVTVQDDNAAQGLGANADFTWEAQNT